MDGLPSVPKSDAVALVKVEHSLRRSRVCASMTEADLHGQRCSDPSTLASAEPVKCELATRQTTRDGAGRDARAAARLAVCRGARDGHEDRRPPGDHVAWWEQRASDLLPYFSEPLVLASGTR